MSGPCNTVIPPAATAPAVRSMSEDDIPFVMRIQAECYSLSMLESETVFRDRLALTPATCWVWAPEQQNPAAYLFAYPSSKGVITALDHPFKIAATPDCLYLHDLAVAPNARGRHAANSLVTAALRHARHDGLLWSALVSVQRSQTFWEALGYAPMEVQHSPAKENLDSYQVSADRAHPVYMLQRLV